MATSAPTAESEAAVSLEQVFALGAFWSLLGAVVSRGLSMLAFLFAARMLGAVGFGEVGMILSTQGMFGVLAGAGLGLATTKFVAEHRSIDWPATVRCARLAIHLATLLGLAAAGMLFALAHEMAESVLGNPQLVNELRVGSALILFASIAGVQTGALMGLGEFRTVSLLGVVRGVCLFTFLPLGILLAGAFGGVVALVLTEASAMIANQLVVRKHFPNAYSSGDASPVAWREISSLCRFGGIAVAGSVCTTLAIWGSSVLLVNESDGYSALGVYTAADRWRQFLLFLPAAVAPIVIPFLSNLHAQNETAGYRKIVVMTLGVNFVAVVLPTLAVMLLANVFMSAFGTDYQTGTTTLVVLAASAIASVLNTTLGQILVSKGAIWWRFAFDVLLAGVLAIVSWQLIPTYRDLGLAYANLAAYSLAAVGLVVPVLYYMRNPDGHRSRFANGRDTANVDDFTDQG